MLFCRHFLVVLSRISAATAEDLTGSLPVVSDFEDPVVVGFLIPLSKGLVEGCPRLFFLYWTTIHGADWLRGSATSATVVVVGSEDTL